MGHVTAADELAYRRHARDWLEANLPVSWRPDRVEYSAPPYAEQIAWERKLYEAGLAA